MFCYNSYRADRYADELSEWDAIVAWYEGSEIEADNAKTRGLTIDEYRYTSDWEDDAIEADEAERQARMEP